MTKSATRPAVKRSQVATAKPVAKRAPKRKLVKATPVTKATQAKAPAVRRPSTSAVKRPSVAAKTTTQKAASGLVSMWAGISTAAVAKATGHGWDYWLKALDKLGAAQLPHKQIVEAVYDKLGLRKNWWVQMI